MELPPFLVNYLTGALSARDSPLLIHVQQAVQRQLKISFWGYIAEDSAQFLSHMGDSNCTPLKCTCWGQLRSRHE